MADVISFLNPKGGAGKSTMALGVASCLEREGQRRVLLVDTDRQGTARDWAAGAPEGASVPTVVGMTDPHRLAKDLPQLSGGYDFCIIDGAAKTQKLLGAAVAASDVVLVPVRPSPADLWAAGELVDTIETRQSVTGGVPAAAFVISAAVVGSTLGAEVEDALKGYSLPVLRARTCQRVVYARELMQGGSVLDHSKSKAAEEIRALTAEIIGLL